METLQPPEFVKFIPNFYNLKPVIAREALISSAM